MPKSPLEPHPMTAPDQDLRAIALVWRNKATPDALACAAQLEDVLAVRAAAERVAAARLLREDAQKQATMLAIRR